MRGWLKLGIFLLVFFVFIDYRISFASVNIFTFSSPSSVSITIYKSKNLSLVQENYWITFKKGSNVLRFSWSKTKIDPSSIRLDILGHSEKIKVEEIVFSPALESLTWKVKAFEPSRELVRVSYFTKDLFWDISYNFCLDQEKNIVSDFNAWIGIENRSGKDYPLAKVEIVTGEPHLIEKKLKKLYKTAIRVEKLEGEIAPVEIRKEAISEYHIYKLEKKVNLMDGEKSQFLLFSSQNLPLKLIYIFNFARWGNFPMVRYKFKNIQNFPLPSGPIRGWVKEDGMRVEYLGEGKINYTPSGGEVEVDIGKEQKLKLERKIITFLRNELKFSPKGDLVQYFEKEEYLLCIENFLKRKVDIKIREEIPGEWSIIYSDIPVNKKEVNALEFELSVEGEEKKQFTYAIRKVVRVR